MDEQERYKRARKRVKQLKEFYSHLGSYVLVISFLAVINVATGSGYPWVIWPALGWGLGLAFHAASVFMPNLFGEDWEDRKIRELMAKDGEKLKTKNDFFYDDEEKQG